MILKTLVESNLVVSEGATNNVRYRLTQDKFRSNKSQNLR